ncbi:MAG: PilZ domain-containing protein [Fimbriimonas sp.]
MPSTTRFATPRVRLERARDGWLSWGWLPYLGSDTARLRFGAPYEVAVGERFTVQVQGGMRVTTFAAEVEGSEGGEVSLKVLGEVRCLSPAQPPRTTVRQIRGLIRVGDIEAYGEVIDASERGAGLLLPIAVVPGVRVTIEVPSEHGTVQVMGEAMYCRPLDTPADRYRVGVQLEPAPFPMSAQWASLIEEDGRQSQLVA